MSAPVTTSWTTVNGSAGSFDAWLALPPTGRGPGLLLLQEIFGVNEHIRTVAEQYALDGFVVLAPDVSGSSSGGWTSATRPTTCSAAARWPWPPTAPRCSATWPMR